VKALSEALWQARATGSTIDAVPLSVDDARAVLQELAACEVAAGNAVAGWKIGRMRTQDGSDFFFAGPVFDGYDRPTRPFVAPRVEVEFVARIGDRNEDGGWAVSWHVGLEIIDNHDSQWSLDPAWCIADWAVQAAGAVGDPCDEPVVGEPVGVRLNVGGREVRGEGRWRTGRESMLEMLERDCARIARPLAAGDLVWSGSLLPPEPLPKGESVQALVEGAGRTVFR
jgi:2-keto-4-pentenoate hydratase